MTSRRLRLLLLFIAAGLGATLLLASPSEAGPARPGLLTLAQPGGDHFRAHLFGDEWYSGYETRAGYTILQGEQGRWRYAERAKDGTLAPSSLLVGRDDPTMRRHLRDSELTTTAARRRAREDATVLRAGATGVQPAPSLGSDKSLVILAQFTDQASRGTTPAQWSTAYFGAGKSVAGYYSAASGGQFTFAPASESSGTANDGVVGWVTLGMNHPDSTAIGALNRQTTRLAIQAADPFVDFAAYDTNADGVVSNTELHITVIAAGNEASYGDHSAKWVWGHRWALFSGEVPTVDGKLVGGFGYTQFGEMHADHMAAMGIMVHELGHDLGLPDLYDTDQSSEGMGVWSVMASGSWGWAPGSGDSWQGQTPPLPDAWSRWYKGWIAPHQVTGTETAAINAASSGVADVAVQMRDNPAGPSDWNWGTSATGEYFLVENRQQTGYDASLPGSGLLVLHVDETRAGNFDDAARLVDVEEADGFGQLDAKTNRGDAGDLYRGGGSTSFTDISTPNSKLNSGSASGASMTSVGANGPTMSAIFQVGPVTPPTAPANDAFADALVASDTYTATVDNANATTETGEPLTAGCSNLGKTVWYRYTPSRNVRVFADTAGSTPTFDTVLNVWQGGSLDNLTARGCNDDTGGTLQSAVDFVAQAGQTYYLQAGGYTNAGATASGALVVHLRVEVVNDRYSRATAITGASGTSTSNNVGGTKETGEPIIAGNNGGASVWWKWTAPASGTVTFDTIGSGAAVDSLLGAYTGSQVNALTLVADNDDIDAATNRKSRVTFAAVGGTTYSLAVDTYNNASPGDLALNWNLTTSATAPGAPTGVSATAGYAAATVSWTPGPANGSSITGYTVTASPGGVTKSVGAGTTSTTVDGLTNGTAYTFTVTATNGIGTSPASAPSAPVTPAGAPSAPTGVSATAGDGSAAVSWTPGAANGSPITGFTVTTFPGGATKDVGAGTTGTTVDGLTNGTAYTFTVKATNGIGTGPESSPSAAVTPAGAPSAPTGVSATAGDASASVSWTPGGANGSPITGYTVTASPGGDTKTVGAGTTSTTLDGLVIGTPYTFTVRATNAVGDSPESSPSNEVTPQAPPDPTDLAVSLALIDHPTETTFAYRATVARTHDPDASPVAVAIQLPSTVQLTEVPDGCVDGATLVCALGPVATGQSQHVDVTVRPLSPGPHAATVLVDVPDADPADDSDSAAATVDFVCDNDSPTAGNDLVTGTTGDDILCGLAGNDTIAGGQGDDLLFGGDGRDTLDYATAPAPMVVNLNFQELTAETAWEKTPGTADGTDLASGFEATSGSPFNDLLLGTLTGADRLWGNGGKDTLRGYAGNDQLYGGAASDKLFGLEGKDLLVGGAGIDRLDGGSQRDTCREKSDKRISCEA